MTADKVRAKKVCSWCGLSLGWTLPVFDIETDGPEPITHGICDPCRARLMAEADNDLPMEKLTTQRGEMITGSWMALPAEAQGAATAHVIGRMFTRILSRDDKERTAAEIFFNDLEDGTRRVNNTIGRE